MAVSSNFAEQCLYPEEIYVRLSLIKSLCLNRFTKTTVDLNYYD